MPTDKYFASLERKATIIGRFNTSGGRRSGGCINVQKLAIFHPGPFMEMHG
jgi:hypothetical protein